RRYPGHPRKGENQIALGRNPTRRKGYRGSKALPGVCPLEARERRMRVAIYLRKSRADLEAEAQGEGDSLARHRRTLLDLAKERGYFVADIKEEIVSGERIAARPKMQELLEEVERGEYDAVLCMDLDRLGRGTLDRKSVVLDTFRESGTRIITPRKEYDLTDEI